MNIYKVSFLSISFTAVKVISLFAISKFVAVVGGPSALTVLGNFQNYSAIIHILSGAMYKTGVVKYIAELKSDNDQEGFLNNFILIAVAQSLLITFLLLFFIDELTNLIFFSSQYKFIVALLLFSLPFVVFSILGISFLNGVGRINDFVLANIFASLTNLILVLVLGIFFGVTGIYIAFATYYIVVSFFAFRLLNKQIKKFSFKIQFETDLVKKLFIFSIITISSICISNFTLITIREILSSSSLPENYSGYWQGVWNLSQIIMSFITILLSTYLLPVVSKSNCFKEINIEILKTLRLIIPLSVFFSTFIFFLREPIILILFTKEFLPMADLFFWQFAGNVIKSIAWIFGFVFVAKGLVKISVITEVVTSLFFIFSCLLLVTLKIESAPTFSYFLTSSFHLIIMFYLYFKISIK